ncbi:MAG TPA: ASCH domain-containing protein [Pelobium sp.]|nr:ASCH domain-containing protein [Pelobium sp.]
MKVILSIKPYYAEKILNGEKTYELRKSIFKVPNIKTVIIYASSPISRIIGEFEIDGIIYEEITSLWKNTKEFTSVDKNFFDEYFADREKGYAIKIKNIKRYDETYSIMEKYGKTAPQSFSYIDK